MPGIAGEDCDASSGLWVLDDFFHRRKGFLCPHVPMSKLTIGSMVWLATRVMCKAPRPRPHSHLELRSMAGANRRG